MNEQELARNPLLSELAVRDLNRDAKLPFADNCFDVVSISVIFALPSCVCVCLRVLFFVGSLLSVPVVRGFACTSSCVS